MTKKERRNLKLAATQERKMLKKYPWFVYEAWRCEPKKRIKYPNQSKWREPEKFCAMDIGTLGWEIAFGEMMRNDLDAEIKKSNLKDFVVEQIKEKYGELRFYYRGGNAKTDEIISAYSHLSSNICVRCGKPDVTSSKRGWIVPMCKKCYRPYGNMTYEDVFGDEYEKMADSYVVHRFSKEGTSDATYDISDYAEKIRKRYRKRKGIACE